MANLKFLKETDGNVVATDNGKTFYPVTTTNAVYDSQSRTLKDILDNEYKASNTNIKDNGIYDWLRNLTEQSKAFTTLTDYNSLNNKVISTNKKFENLSSEVNVFKSLINSVSENFRDEIKKIEWKMYIPEFDDVPTKGSTKLLNSGALYSYLSKIVSKNMFDITIVTDMDKYDADNGDIVMYGGQNTDDYKFGSLYMAKVEYVRNPDSICHEKIKQTSWLLLGSMIGNGGCDCDCYSKSEIDDMLRNLPIYSSTKYYGGKYITIDENNFINANIPETDLSDYYNKDDVNKLIEGINKNANRYFAGDNIRIDGNTISALVPDTSNLVTLQQVNDIVNGIKTNNYIAGTGILIDNNVISAVSNIDERLDEESDNAISNKIVTQALSKKLASNDVANVALSGSYNDLKDLPSPETINLEAGSDNVKIETDDSADNRTVFTISVDGADVPVNDVKVNGQSVVEDKVANISIPSVQIENKNAYLMFGEKTKVANINGTDISVLMPEKPETSVLNNNPTLEFGKQATIGSVNDTELTIVMPQKPKASVENKNATLSYGEESTIAKVDGVDIKVTMPASTVVPGVSVVNNNASLNYGEASTIGSINGTELTITMPSKPETEKVSVVNKNATLVYGDTTTLASVNGTDINVTMPAKPEGADVPVTDVQVNGVSVVTDKIARMTLPSGSVSNKAATLEYGQTKTIANVYGQDITVTMPAAPSGGGSEVTVNNYNTPLSWNNLSTIATINGTDIKVKLPENPTNNISINLWIHEMEVVLYNSNSTKGCTLTFNVMTTTSSQPVYGNYDLNHGIYYPTFGVYDSNLVVGVRIVSERNVFIKMFKDGTINEQGGFVINSAKRNHYWQIRGNH